MVHLFWQIPSQILVEAKATEILLTARLILTATSSPYYIFRQLWTVLRFLSVRIRVLYSCTRLVVSETQREMCQRPRASHHQSLCRTLSA